MTEVLDDRLRSRLAEIRASAGVPHAQISLEVLYFLPKGFLEAYGELFLRAIRQSSEGDRAAAAQAAAGVGKARGAGAKTNGKRWKNKAFAVKDERALRAKTRIDQQLRALGRTIASEISVLDSAAAGEGKDPSKTGLQCSGCKLFLDNKWRFCPQCGKDREVS